MLGLVAAANVFMVFIFWELVGVCSYLLIGFWYEEKKNADAANKAFVTNRVGDVGMLIGLGLLWTTSGRSTSTTINRSLRDGSGRLSTIASDMPTAVKVADARPRAGRSQPDATRRPRHDPALGC